MTGDMTFEQIKQLPANKLNGLIMIDAATWENPDCFPTATATASPTVTFTPTATSTPEPQPPTATPEATPGASSEPTVNPTATPLSQEQWEEIRKEEGEIFGPSK